MILHKLPPFQNVAASVTAILPNIPLGMTIYGIILKRGGTFTNAHLSNIKFNLDSKRVVDITGPHLLVQNNYLVRNLLNYLLDHVHVENTAGTYTQNANTNGPTAYSSSYDLIPFSDFNARTVGGELMGGIDTSVGYRNAQLEIDIGAATSPTLEGWAILGPPKADKDPNKMTIAAILKRIESPGAAGEFDLQVPVGSRSGTLIHRVFFHHSNGQKLQVLRDGLYLLQEGEDALVKFWQAIRHRRPQSGLFVYDPSPNDNQSESVSTVRANLRDVANLQWKFTVSGSDTVTIYSHMYTTLDRI